MWTRHAGAHSVGESATQCIIGAHRTERIVQRTSAHCPRSGAEYAACNAQHALSQQLRCGHKPRNCANATRIAQHPACNAQHANNVHGLPPLAAKTGAIQHATCNTSARHATSNIRAPCAAHVAACNTKMQHVHTPCNTLHTCAAQVATCNMRQARATRAHAPPWSSRSCRP